MGDERGIQRRSLAAATLLLAAVVSWPAQAEQAKKNLSLREITPAADPVDQAAPPLGSKLTFVVFGDAFGASVARGMTDAYRSRPEIIIDDRTDDDSELTRADAVAWDKAVETALHADRPLAAAVIMLGADETGPLSDSKGKAQAPGTPDWRRLYGDRVERLAGAFRDKHVPLIWVGLPIVRDGADAKTYADLNGLYRERATKAGATFIDVWDPFTDDNGQYATEGPDVNGQDAVLRRSDGWGFTRAGARTLASFLEPDLKRAQDVAATAVRLANLPIANPDTFDQALQIDINAQIRGEAGLSSQATSAVVGPVVSLTAAPISPGGLLAPIHPGQPEADPFVPQTRASLSHAGRTDDFRLAQAVASRAARRSRRTPHIARA